MRVLIIGSNGQLGSDLVSEFQQKTPFDIITLNREDLNLENLDQIKSVINKLEFDILVNCASYHITDEVERNSDLAFKVNSSAVECLAQCCKQKNAILYHYSTDYIFGGDETKKSPYSELDPPSPINIYGSSKLLGENLAKITSRNVVIIRVASLFGLKGSRGKGGNFIETILSLSKKKSEIEVVDDQIMSPTYTKDVARITLKLADNKVTNGTYHLVNSGSASWYQLAQKIIQLTKSKLAITPISSLDYKTVAKRPKFSVLDNSKIQNHFSITLRSWDEALYSYLKEKGHI